jgi:hypothetical protein
VWTALDRGGNTDLVVSQPLGHWALFKRPHNELLPRNLQLVKEEEPPAGIILYALTVYDETHPDAFKTGQFGRGTGGGNDGDGDDKERKGKPPPTPSRDISHTAKTGTTTPSKPSGSKRKAPEGRAEDTSGPRGSQRPKPTTPVLKKQEKVGTTASAIIPGVDAEGSAPRGEWHSALQAAISGPGSNFLRLQQLIGQLQTALPAGQPAQRLSVLDFLKLQGLIAEWVDSAPAQLIPPANYKLLELCGSLLLPAAIRMSVEAARVITALINALLYGVLDVMGTVEMSRRGPRERDRDDDGCGPRGHTERITGEASRPVRTEQRERRDDRRDDGGCQRETEQKGRRHGDGETKQAAESLAGLTLKTPPTTGTWPCVRLFFRITHGGWPLTLCVLPYNFQKKLERAFHEEETISPRTPPTPTAEHCALHFIGAPAVVYSNSNKPRAAPLKPTPATTMTMAARQDVLRRLLGQPDDPPRTATPPPRIDKPAVARLVRPHLPRVEIPSLPTVFPSAGPMSTPTVPPPPAQGLPSPPPRNPAIDGPESPSMEELAVSRADARVQLIVTEQEAMHRQLVSERQREDVEARLVAARAEAGRQRDIFNAARRQMERELGGPLPPPPLPERPSARGNCSDREAIQKAQFNQVMDARREVDARVWDYAEQRDIEGLLEERRRQTTENLAQRRSGSKSGGSKSGGSKSGGSDERRKKTPPSPRRELTPPRRPTPPRARARTPTRAPTPSRDRTRSDRRGDRRARTPSPPPRRRLRSDFRDRGPPRTTQERRPGPSSRGGKK